MNDLKQLNSELEMKGWLYKWTNYIKGYQKRWFVLSNGLLSYYRTQAEMAHTCRGTISLQGAVIHTEDTCTLVISNGGTQTFHLKASSEVERQKWVTALELAKAKAIRLMESEDDEEYDMPSHQHDKYEVNSVLKSMNAKLEDLHTCNELIVKHGAALQRSLAELEQLELPAADLSSKAKTVNERATLFRITANAMIKACNDYLQLVQNQGRKWQRLRQHEHDQRRHLEEMVEQLARQHSHLEQAAKEATSSGKLSGSGKQSGGFLSDDDDSEFYDAPEHADDDFMVTIPSSKGYRRTGREMSRSSDGGLRSVGHDSSSESDDGVQFNGQEAKVVTRKRRKGFGSEQDSLDADKESAWVPNAPLPSDGTIRRQRRRLIPERPNQSVNLWSIMKNCIGKDLTKIPMPVNFSEPLSMLQRLTEEFEYSELLDKAATIEDSCEQLAYVAVYTVTAYATTSTRTGKPFNPLLGETYECDRSDDYGWKAFAEQVSHHPPVAAQHCRGRGWTCWQEFSISSKFRGKYLQIVPLGVSHLLFNKSGNHYTWRKVTTMVHNIIVGKLWVDQHGEMDIINHTTGDKCHLKYVPYSYFSREVPRKVTGIVTQKSDDESGTGGGSGGRVKWVLSGTWDNKMEAARVLGMQSEVKGKPVLETSTPRLLWKRRWPPPEYERIYNFTLLAIQLNEVEEGVAPTDSRNRPDQRLMENAQWDEANVQKLLLEDKQRTVRRRREQEAEKAMTEGRPYPAYEPVWFKKQKDPLTGNLIHVFTDKYWECKEQQDWSPCPDIF